MTEAAARKKRRGHSNGKESDERPAPLPERCLDEIFYETRTRNKWFDRDIPDATLHELVNLLKLGPTSANSSPARFLFVRSRGQGAAKAAFVGRQCGQDHGGAGMHHHRLRSRLLRTPAEALSSHQCQELVRGQRREDLRGHPRGAVQGVYLIMAARPFGLDCGPMSGFDNAGVDPPLLPAPTSNRTSRAVLAMATSVLFTRSPRFGFDRMARII